MQVKKFIGENTPQVMALIRKEFGDDAIILQTNKIKTGGLFGFFQKEMVEILAARDNEVKNNGKSSYPRTMNTSVNNYNRNKTDEIEVSSKYPNTDFKFHMDNINDIQSKRQENFIENNLTNTVPKPAIYQKSDIGKEAMEVKEDIDEIKNTVKQLSKKINDTFKTPEEEEEYRQEQEAIENLQKLGLSYQFSKEVVTNIKKSGKIITYDNLKNEIISMLSNNKKVDFDNTSKYMVFVGPTGVGKTTTLAKISSKEAIEKRKKIGFLTLDTYRISAVEQLKTYAEILSSPIEVAYEIQDLNTAIERLSNRDMVFIDTAGRSHNNKGQIEDLKNVLDNIKEKKVYIVVSANMNLQDIYDILDIYDFIEDYDIIVTKIDETRRYGNLLDIMNKTGKNIAYTSFGQNVPDDIEKFNLETYVCELIGEMYK